VPPFGVVLQQSRVFNVIVASLQLLKPPLTTQLWSFPSPQVCVPEAVTRDSCTICRSPQAAGAAEKTAKKSTTAVTPPNLGADVRIIFCPRQAYVRLIGNWPFRFSPATFPQFAA
jgi:hypothetical protein